MWVLLYALPVTILIIIGIPLACFLVLRANRHRLKEKEVVTKYGFHILGLSNDTYYWEVLLTLRKILIIAVNSALALEASIYKSFTATLVMLLSLEVLRRLKPYESRIAYDLEYLSSFSCAVSLLFGTFLVSVGDDLPEAIKYTIMALIGISHMAFLVRFFKEYYKLKKDKIKESLRKLK